MLPPACFFSFCGSLLSFCLSSVFVPSGWGFGPGTGEMPVGQRGREKLMIISKSGRGYEPKRGGLFSADGVCYFM